jgi:hypothetical protein
MFDPYSPSSETGLLVENTANLIIRPESGPNRMKSFKLELTAAVVCVSPARSKTENQL